MSQHFATNPEGVVSDQTAWRRADPRQAMWSTPCSVTISTESLQSLRDWLCSRLVPSGTASALMGPFTKPWSLSFMVACKTPRSISWSPELFTLASKTSRARLATLLSASVGSWLADLWSKWFDASNFPVRSKSLQVSSDRQTSWEQASTNSSLKSNIFLCRRISRRPCDMHSLKVSSTACNCWALENNSPHHFRSALCNLRHWVVQAKLHGIQHGPWHLVRCYSWVFGCNGCFDELLRSPVNSYCFQSCTRDIPHGWRANKACIWRQGIFSRDLHDVVELTDQWQTGGRKYLARAKIHTCEICFGTCHEWSSSLVSYRNLIRPGRPEAPGLASAPNRVWPTACQK